MGHGKGENPNEHLKSIGNRLGTFGGVFTPSILTILEAIMFMRAEIRLIRVVQKKSAGNLRQTPCFSYTATGCTLSKNALSNN